MNKIFIYRLGGLGNQLFQIANGYSLSRVNNKELVINPKTNDGIDSNTYRNNFNDLFNNFKKEEIPVELQYFVKMDLIIKKFQIYLAVII